MFACVQLDTRGDKRRRTEADQVHVETRKAVIACDRAGVPLADLEGQRVTLPFKVCPGQKLLAGRFEDHLLGAIGECMQREFLAPPLRRAMLSRDLDAKVPELDIE